MPDPSDVVVHAFEKNKREVVQTSLRHYEGRDLVDIRIYYRAASGEVKPTQKGVTVDQRLLDELEAGVRAARAAIAAWRGT